VGAHFGEALQRTKLGETITMVDITAIAGAVTSLRSAIDITKALKDVTDANLVQTKVFELTREILTAQASALDAREAQRELMDKIRELEAQVRQFEAWEVEKRRYQLKDYGGNTFAYELRPDAANGEPIHRVCPTCFQQRRLDILQFHSQTSDRQDKYGCKACKMEFLFGIRQSRPLNDGRGAPGW
jgi:hypothetical protein